MKHITLILLLTLTTTALAKNIDLSTVPRRDTVQLTIYNAEDITLVRETRHITFKKGINPLQFSWANTLIDPTSVELRFLTAPDHYAVLDTTYPHDKPQMLYWNIAADQAGEATVEISYFTSGITWSADYVAITNADETSMHVEGFVTVANNSGEDYEDAEVRLVVGTINLVEQIAQLAQSGLAGQRQAGRLRGVAMRRAVKKAEAELMFADSSVSVEMEEEKQIVKEGLSEYFIFAIEGTETIPHTWRKRLRSFEATDAPMEVEYRYREREYGRQLVRLFLLTNNEEAGLGQSPLPDGQVRIFRHKGERGLGYVAQQTIKYIPIGDKIELNVGPDPNVVFELQAMHVYRDNIWGTFNNKIRRRMDGKGVPGVPGVPGVRVEDRGRVEGWDEHTVYEQVIRNYTPKPISVQIRRVFHGDMTFTSRLGATSHDYQTVQYDATVEPAESARLRYEMTQRQGTNFEQNRVVVKAADPTDVPWAD